MGLPLFLLIAPAVFASPCPGACSKDNDCFDETMDTLLVCKGGVCSNPDCITDSQCPAKSSCNNGRCVNETLIPLNGQCDVTTKFCLPGLACVSGKCTSQSCFFHEQCGGDLVCIMGSCQYNPYYLSGLGGKCGINWTAIVPCRPPLRCSAISASWQNGIVGTCFSPIRRRCSCSAHSQCVSGICAGVCLDLSLSINDACTINSQCLSGLCKSGRCAGTDCFTCNSDQTCILKPNGNSAEQAYTCLGPCNAQSYLNLTTQKCVKLGNAGDSCNMDSNCNTGLACYLGTCQSYLQGILNALCLTDADCQAPLYCSATQSGGVFGTCIQPKATNTTCATSRDCGSSQYCNDASVCVPYTQIGAPCSASSSSGVCGGEPLTCQCSGSTGVCTLRGASTITATIPTPANPGTLPTTALIPLSLSTSTSATGGRWYKAQCPAIHAIYYADLPCRTLIDALPRAPSVVQDLLEPPQPPPFSLYPRAYELLQSTFPTCALKFASLVCCLLCPGFVANSSTQPFVWGPPTDSSVMLRCDTPRFEVAPVGTACSVYDDWLQPASHWLTQTCFPPPTPSPTLSPGKQQNGDAGLMMASAHRAAYWGFFSFGLALLLF